MAQDKEQLIDHLFRTEYGKLVSTLTRLFGTAYIQLAEDVVQDALITAIGKWGVEGIPDNPTAWLIQVAKRKALNELKRNQMKTAHGKIIAAGTQSHDEINNIFLANEIEDSQLRMIFTCCHPSLSAEAQIVLTLKTLCGFGIQELANALLTNKSTINKKLYRAKASIKNSQIPFSIPSGNELTTRLQSVSTTLYLLFNEGYNASSGDSIIQKEFCLEAIRLTQLISKRFEQQPQLKALLALMYFHTSRFEARLDDRGGIIIFEEQNRSRWNKVLIQQGMYQLRASMNSDNLSAYHIEASIAAQHCLAESFDQTDWQSIYDNYLLLSKIKPNPIIQLNLAIILSKLKGVEKSLEALKQLETNAVLKNYHLLPATQGILYLKKKQFKLAILYLEKALKLQPSMRESEFIKSKIAACQISLQ